LYYAGVWIGFAYLGKGNVDTEERVHVEVEDVGYEISKELMEVVLFV